jgi:arsenate reductase
MFLHLFAAVKWDFGAHAASDVPPARREPAQKFDDAVCCNQLEDSRILPAARETGMTKTATIYGIKNCETMNKARAWLEKHGVDYAFHDYKTAGIDRERLERWCKKVGWETLLNRAGMTFRKLPDKDKAGINEKKAIALILAQPSMIKRPVLDLGGGKLVVGFKPEVYDEKIARA